MGNYRLPGQWQGCPAPATASAAARAPAIAALPATGLVDAFAMPTLAPTAGPRPRQVKALASVHRMFLRKWGFEREDYVVPGYCEHCGPAWMPVAFAGDATWRFPVCPWCPVVDAGHDLMRPPVDCASCRHFERPVAHPDSDQGWCLLGRGERRVDGRRGWRVADWHHQCGAWEPQS